MDNKPAFWRDSNMPHVELREIEDGGKISYAAHSHKEWSIGAILNGESTFLCGVNEHQVDTGALVLMNPEQMHACNPAKQSRWSYYMLYIDHDWLATQRHQLGHLQRPIWQDVATEVVRDKALFDQYLVLGEALKDDTAELLRKQSELLQFLDALFGKLENRASNTANKQPSTELETVSRYMDEHCAENLSLDTLATLANCSPGYFIKAFKTHSGFTPHAYLINRRVQLGQQLLKQGHPIADAALAAGFSDQAHFQRIFKKLVAATPRQYQ